mgnify:CR=1 FL=1
MWKDIKNYEGWYQVSDSGQVRSLDREVKYRDGRKRVFKGTVLKPRFTKGYPTVNLGKNKKMETFQVHRIVANHFLEKPSYAECVNHIDGIKTNNNVSNLEWVTYARNNQHAREMGLNNSKGEPLVKYNEQIKIKVVMLDKDKLIRIENYSRDMAKFVKKYCNVESNIETIARCIRSVCKQNEIGLNKIEPTKRRKTAYGYSFKYLKDYSETCID